MAGRPPKEKSFANMLRIAVTEDNNLRVIADKLVEAAKNGEGWAIQQVADRLDGKPQQSVDIDANVTFEDMLARLK